MKKKLSLAAFLLVLALSTGYAAICQDFGKTVMCGSQCGSGPSGCACEGPCSAAELEAIL